MDDQVWFWRLWLLSVFVIVVVMLWDIHHDAGRPFL